jgi:hypothetical protein
MTALGQQTGSTTFSLVRIPVSGTDDVERPLAGNALERTGTKVLELDPRARHQVLHRARDEHRAGSGLGRHARADADGDAGELAVV